MYLAYLAYFWHFKLNFVKNYDFFQIRIKLQNNSKKLQKKLLSDIFWG
jgi:hypothetical protein